MGMFRLLKKSEHCNPPSFKERLRLSYDDNTLRGKSSQIPWYRHINTLLWCGLLCSMILINILGVPYFVSVMLW